ncbi:glycosyl hydrolase [Paenibacillus psychroresistens]|nr:glycosyl hydrolase [Paenibacillus psychroresistens]
MTDNPIGFPSRALDLDVYPGFLNPPKGYGEVAFYWWIGEKLTKERLLWQLEQLKDHHITGLQVNYAHSDEGGDSYGYSYPSDPPLFSEDWWELFGWFAEKCGERGITVSLSDYTLCSPGQGWYTDEILSLDPSMVGTNLKHMEWNNIVGLLNCTLPLPSKTLSITAYKINENQLEPITAIDLIGSKQDNIISVFLPEGNWRIVAVYSEVNTRSLDPMHPNAGAKVIEHFFQRFEDRLSGIPNAKLGFFFSDELDFGIRGLLWNNTFHEEFMQRKGYDLLPELAALFTDIGPRTTKVRLDYKDVLVALSEEHYFIPVYSWHQERGMIYGCDHGGRGTDLVEFGDYFRTQRWNQGPGCDQPRLECDLVKNKVASSIAHLYNRPRTWLEGYHSSGWSTNTAQLTEATFRNFATGHNLLSLHGLYYTTLGGWWEWAPPCNHFRMPYWPHMESFLACSERLSYLLSQGTHACDVAILYPVASVEAGIDGEAAVKTSFAIGEHLYQHGIDFDYMDFESLDRAEVKDQELRVSGEAYRVLILPAMRTLRYSTLLKALEFYNAGGIVIALGFLPIASENAGLADPELDQKVFELFGMTASKAAELNQFFMNENQIGGKAIFAITFAEVTQLITNSFPRDFVCLDVLPENEFPYIMHRKIGSRDLYMVHGAPKGTKCFFRCHGSIELWDPWTGAVTEIQAYNVTSEGTTILLPLDSEAAHLIVFQKRDELTEGTQLQPTLSLSTNTSSKKRDELNHEWEFELQPTLNNQFGDFRLPAAEEIIGAEASSFRFALETTANPGWENSGFNDSEWQNATSGYGPYFWKLGPIPKDSITNKVESQLSTLLTIKPGDSVMIGGHAFPWQTYEFSMRYGVEGDPGHQGYHGLKGKVTDQFFALGKANVDQTETVYSSETAGDVYYLWSTFDAEGETKANMRMDGNLPASIWLNSSKMELVETIVSIEARNNHVLLRYDNPGRSSVVFEALDTPLDWQQAYPLAMSWYKKPGLFPYNVRLNEHFAAGWYRFTAPPGLQAMEITAYGDVEAWANGIKLSAESSKKNLDGSLTYTITTSEKLEYSELIALRIRYNSTHFAGAAIPQPIRFTCSTGLIKPGDWSKIDGLYSYSGGVIYRTSYIWDQLQSPVESKVLLDLGKVISTAEIRINGNHIGTLVAPPWKLDIGTYLQTGQNLIEILVYNTLANHYTTIPTRFRGDLTSGLLGPVVIEIN